MPRYRIYMVEESVYEIEVEAADEKEAEDIAEREWEAGRYRHVGDGNRRIDEVKEVPGDVHA